MLMLTLLDNESSWIQRWAKHKLQPWVACGLNKGLTEVDPSLFDFLRKSTNAAEQTHHKSNTRGIGLSLLVAIQR